jgi:diadenosine tetraphosphate (Ap4A) HIT family hydrolase
MDQFQKQKFFAEAVYHAFKPEKLNYELLGNGDTHIHWHIFPRVAGDTPINGPVWWLPKEEMWNDNNIPTTTELQAMVTILQEEIDKLI